MLERDEFRMDRHRALSSLLFERDRFGKPVLTHRVVARGHAFPEHAVGVPPTDVPTRHREGMQSSRRHPRYAPTDLLSRGYSLLNRSLMAFAVLRRADM